MTLHDRRLLYIFIVLLIIAGLFATYVQHNVGQLNAFRRASVANCLQNRKNTQAFNQFIGKLQAVTLGSSLLSKQEQRQRVAFYQSAKTPVPQCPPSPSGPLRGRVDPPPAAPTKGIPQP